MLPFCPVTGTDDSLAEEPPKIGFRLGSLTIEKQLSKQTGWQWVKVLKISKGMESCLSRKWERLKLYIVWRVMSQEVRMISNPEPRRLRASLCPYWLAYTCVPFSKQSHCEGLSYVAVCTLHIEDRIYGNPNSSGHLPRWDGHGYGSILEGIRNQSVKETNRVGTKQRTLD